MCCVMTATPAAAAAAKLLILMKLATIASSVDFWIYSRLDEAEVAPHTGHSPIM